MVVLPLEVLVDSEEVVEEVRIMVCPGIGHHQQLILPEKCEGKVWSVYNLTTGSSSTHM